MAKLMDTVVYRGYGIQAWGFGGLVCIGKMVESQSYQETYCDIQATTFYPSVDKAIEEINRIVDGQ